MRFIGLDLAWSRANPSAAVALAWDDRQAYPVSWEASLGGDEEILDFLDKAAGDGPALIAVDAPLVVPNEDGMRTCDRELSRFYRRAQGQAYPANRRRLAPVRGEILVEKLEALGFRHSPLVQAQRPGRQVIEVFPHPAAVELFGLSRILRYKARTGRSYELRWAELQRFRELLQSLGKREPAMDTGEVLAPDPYGLRGRSLKRLEDLLDALFCAYIALHIWYFGPDGHRQFGDLESGYILVPIPPESLRAGRSP